LAAPEYRRSVSTHYAVKPRADQDLDDYSDYLASKANLEVALRFLAAARETFALLAAQPNMGWRSRLRHAALKSLRIFRVSGFEHMLILYRPLPDGVDIPEGRPRFAKSPSSFPAPQRDRVMS
jgi:plasmid stabilization system protein ParE